VSPKAEPAGPEKETPPANRRSYEPIRNEIGRPPGHGKKERVMGTRATGIARRVSLQGEATLRCLGFVWEHSAFSSYRRPSEYHGFASRTGAHCTLGDFPNGPGRSGGSVSGLTADLNRPPANHVTKRQAHLAALCGCIVPRINEIRRRRVTPVPPPTTTLRPDPGMTASRPVPAEGPDRMELTRGPARARMLGYLTTIRPCLVPLVCLGQAGRSALIRRIWEDGEEGGAHVNVRR